MKIGKLSEKEARRMALVIIIAAILIAPGAYAKERKGVQLKLRTKDGAVLMGELLTVKGRDLILMSIPESQGSNENISNLTSIRIVKKSKFVQGLQYGVLGGVAVGALVGAVSIESDKFALGATAEGALSGGMFGGIFGALVGGTVGIVAGADETFELQGRSDADLNDLLFKLNRLSRSPS